MGTRLDQIEKMSLLGKQAFWAVSSNCDFYEQGKISKGKLGQLISKEIAEHLHNNGIRTAEPVEEDTEMGSNGMTKAQNREYARVKHSKYPWTRPYYKARERYLTIPEYQKRGFDITKEEVRELWVRDKAELMDSPSIDRKDNDKGYTKENCRFIELHENIARQQRKPVVCLNDNGRIMGRFPSAKDAEDVCNIDSSLIRKCCKGIRNYTGGFNWQYEEK